VGVAAARCLLSIRNVHALLCVREVRHGRNHDDSAERQFTVWAQRLGFVGWSAFAAASRLGCSSGIRHTATIDSVLDRTGINVRATELNQGTLSLITSYGFGGFEQTYLWRTSSPARCIRV